MPSTESTEASGTSTFHRLLKQLGEEHDREVAMASGEATKEQNQWEKIHSMGESSEALMLTARPFVCNMGSTHETRQQFTAEADTMVKIQSEGMHTRSCKGFLDSQKDQIALHPEWSVESEKLKISKTFSFSNTWHQSWMEDALKHGEANRLSSASANLRLGLMERLKSLTIVRVPGAWSQVFWDFIGILCITFDLIWIPVQFGFEAEDSAFVTSVEWIMRMFWTGDMLATCTLAYQTYDGLLERRLWMITWKYLKSRKFWLDLLVVTGDWIPIIQASTSTHKEPGVDAFSLLRIGKIQRTLRILRILRLARVVKVEHFMLTLRDNLLVSCESISLVCYMMKNMICILLCCHFSACIWYFIGNSPSDNHWVHYYELGGRDVPLQQKYMWSFHYVTTQWTPASMEVQPRNPMERQFSVCLIVGGIMFYSTFMGAITASITSLRNLHVYDFSQFYMLRRYLYENGISRSLTIRISRYTELALEMHRKRIDREKVQYLKLLSGPLHVELQKEIYLPHLRIHTFFADYNEWDASAMSHLCFVALARTSVAKGDTLFSLGAEATRMYCAVTGTFIYQRRRGLKIVPNQTRPKRMARVGPLVWCCESSLWVRWYHFGSMSALIECEVVEVDALKFREVTSSRGSVFSRSVCYARTYAKSMFDDHGYAWDVPSTLLYPGDDTEGQSSLFWWQREVIAAETEEARWWASMDDSASETEETRRVDGEDPRRVKSPMGDSDSSLEDLDDCYRL